MATNLLKKYLEDNPSNGYTTNDLILGTGYDLGGSLNSASTNSATGNGLLGQREPNYGQNDKLAASIEPIINSKLNSTSSSTAGTAADQWEKSSENSPVNTGGGNGGGNTATATPSFSYSSAPSFNYSGGSEFSYENAPTYTSQYQDQINQMVNALLNKDAFSYDAASDPLYQQYSDQYTRLGNQAMVDTLGQVSARTGGLASSYAGTAAQNAYNDYMQQLADKVPELYQLAYSMYNDQDTKERNNIALIQALEDGDYNRYLDLLSQYNTDRSFAYNQYNNDRDFAYNQYQDQLAQYNKDRSLAYSQYQDQLSASSGSSGASGSSGSSSSSSTSESTQDIYSRLSALGATDYNTALNLLHTYEIGDKAYRDDLAKGFAENYSNANDNGIIGNAINSIKDTVSNSKLGQTVSNWTSSLLSSASYIQDIKDIAKTDKNSAKEYAKDLYDNGYINKSTYNNYLANIEKM